MRTVLVLRFYDDLSQEETAALLGCAVGTVKSQTSLGLARMRELLGPTALGCDDAGTGVEGITAGPTRTRTATRPRSGPVPAMKGESR